MDNNDAREVAIYPLTAPDTVIAAQRDLAAVLFEAQDGHEGRRVVVSPASGCVSFTDERRLWVENRGNSGSPSRARHAAEKHLEALRVRLDRENHRRTGNARMTPLPAVIPSPDQATFSEVKAVAPPGAGFCHWLARFSVVVPNGDRRVAVIGSHIDIRVNADEQMVAFDSTWRPTQSRQAGRRLPLPDDVVRADSELPKLVYVLPARDDPATFLAPFYTGGPLGGGWWPASERSIAAAIGIEPRQDGSTYVAGAALRAAGQARDLTFQWAVWRPDRGLAEGMSHPTPQRTRQVVPIPGSPWAITTAPLAQRLEAGIYDVSLLVRDERSGMIASAQEVIYAGVSKTQAGPLLA